MYDKLQIYGDDYDTHDGTCIRDYIHVSDLSEGHIASFKKFDNPGLYIYNLGSGHGTSVFQLIDSYQKVNDIQIPYEISQRRKGDLPILLADVTKAKLELE